jgi:hypothetical protein
MSLCGCCPLLQFVLRKSLKQRSVDEVNVTLVCKQITPNCAAGVLVCLPRNKPSHGVAHWHFILRKRSAEGFCRAPCLGQLTPYTLLTFMIIDDCESHEVL